MYSLILFGGTFDPIHNGHINTALKVQEIFNFDEFIFLPNKIPLLKDKAQASTKDRLKMLELAINSATLEKFKISRCEIDRDGPSYMVDSLHYFRQQYGKDCAITLLMGEDTFNQLPQWHKSNEILSLANILIIKRAGFISFNTNTLALLEKHKTETTSDLKEQPYGSIYQFNAGLFPISSSYLRDRLKTSNQGIKELISEDVLAYIEKNHLYELN